MILIEEAKFSGSFGLARVGKTGRTGGTWEMNEADGCSTIRFENAHALLPLRCHPSKYNLATEK